MNDYTGVEPKASRIVYITYSFDNLTLVCAMDSIKHGHNDRFMIYHVLWQINLITIHLPDGKFYLYVDTIGWKINGGKISFLPCVRVIERTRVLFFFFFSTTVNSTNGSEEKPKMSGKTSSALSQCKIKGRNKIIGCKKLNLGIFRVFLDLGIDG